MRMIISVVNRCIIVFVPISVQAKANVCHCCLVFNVPGSHFTIMKGTSTICTGGWGNSRAGLDGCGKCCPHQDSNSILSILQ